MISVTKVSLLVREYDEAIDFYVHKLGFTLIQDTVMSPEKRWVEVAPPGNGGCVLLLAKATNEEQQSRIGNQTGGRVFLFVYTDNIQADLERLLKHNVTIVRPLSEEVYGKVLVFADLYGNKFDLIEPPAQSL